MPQPPESSRPSELPTTQIVPGSRPTPADQTPPNTGGRTAAPATMREGGRGTAPMTAPADVESPNRAGRYRLDKEIGRGGMGVVYRAHDPDINRNLAVKVLQVRYLGQTDLESRFLEEAQLTGQLQHPGIAPVHEIGRLPDSRPFFAMKLIQGRTLAALLADRSTPAQDLPRFLRVFVQVCQTVAYAHSKGVIHRDLKPDNVMVGAFGEVQVMDWGLAKLVGRERSPATGSGGGPGTDVVHPSGSGVSSRVGEVLGTPAYMAPEQARGEVDQLDDRCDVFGLGGILCAVLTGLPPYRGPTMSDYLRQASGVELEDAFTRLDGCGAEPELVHLAKQCLAADREARPRDAGAVAQAVIDYQAGVEERLRRAELERAQAAIEAREERKRRRLAVALAAAVVGLVLVAGGAAWWLERQHARQQEERARREAQTRQAVALALERAEAALRQGNWGEADKALAEAASRMADDGPADLREPLLRLRNDRGRATRLQEISVNRLAGGPSFQVAVAYSDLDRDARKEEVRLDRSVWVEGQFDEARAAAAYAREFAEAGLAELEPGAVAAAVRVSPIRDVWIATLDDWALVEPDVARRARLLQTARQVDPDPWRDQLRDPAVWEDQQALERLAAAISVAEVSPQLLALLSERLAALGGDVLPLLDAAQQQHPTAFRINLLLGKKLIPVTGPEGAAAPGFLRAALVAQPESIAVLNNLAVALYTRRRLDEALIVLDKALRIAPRHAMLHLHRGHVLRDQGWPDEAAGAYEEAARCDPKLVDAPYNLGVVRYAARRFAEAEAAFRTATQVDATYVRAQVLLGLALHAQTKLEEAAVALETARKLQPDSFAVWFHLGMVRYDQRRSDEAIAAFKKAASVAPKHVTVRRFLGQALFQKGQFAEAREVFRGGLELVAPPDPAHKMLTALAARSERLHGLDQKLPEYLRPGASVPSLADQRDLAVLCLMPHRRLYAASARFYGAALDADPKLANNLAAGHLYHAACAAVLAADGQGKDASRLSEAERVHLRKQALGWLRAELDLWTKRVQDRPANQAEIRLALEYRRQDSDLASVRGAGALAKLPASERGDWEKLWADLNALIEKVGGSASDSR